jgi:Zn-dependent protease
MNLSFRLGKIPVRILPSFFITTVILFGLTDPEPRKILVWAMVVLASVLVHELGHALAGVAFGLQPRIDLHGFGGTTSWAPSARISSGKRIVISLAGPFMGFVTGFTAIALHKAFGAGLSDSPLAEFTYVNLLYVNFVWGILNLLPMLPLDGGNVLTHTLEIAMPGRAERPTRIVSLIVATLGTAVALVYQMWYAVLLGGSFAVSNWRALGDVRAREHDAPMRAQLEAAYAALDAKDAPRVLAIARPIAAGSQTAAVRAEALQLLAFGFLLEGRVADADAAIASLPHGFAPHSSLLELRATVTKTPPA